MLLKLFIIHIEQKGSKKTYFLLILLNLIIYLGLSCNSICILDKYIPIIPINSVLSDATNIISVLICNISLLFISIIINIINVINASITDTITGKISGNVENATILSIEYLNNFINDHLVLPATLSTFLYSNHLVL